MSRNTPAEAASEVHLKRSFNTSVDVLFDCFTKPDLVVRWWGPKGAICPAAESDLQIGGRYRYQILSQESGNLSVATGEYLQIDRPRRLVFSWCWEHAPDEISRVSLVFRLLGSTRSELELTHRPFASLQQARAHDAGWTSSLDKLEQLTIDLT